MLVASQPLSSPVFPWCPWQVLELYTVPPGRFVTVSASVASHLFKDELCPSPDPNSNITGWLSIDPPEAMIGKLMLPPRRECSLFCAPEATARMMGARGSGGDDAFFCELARTPPNDCCRSRAVPTLSEVGLLQMLLNPCATGDDCIAAVFDGKEHRISMGNDCLLDGDTYVADFLHCPFYARDLRRHFVARLDHLRALHPHTSSPVHAAVRESIGVTITAEHGPEMRRHVFATLAEPRAAREPGGAPPAYWGDPSPRNDPAVDPVTIDQVANTIYDKFKRVCSGD